MNLRTTALLTALATALPLLPGTATPAAAVESAKVERHNETWPATTPPKTPAELEADRLAAAAAAQYVKDWAAANPADPNAPDFVPQPDLPDREIDIELVMLLDSSDSVDQTEYDLQLDGYRDAFRDPEVHAVIEAQNGVFVSIVDFSSTYQRRIIADHLLFNAQDCLNFANDIDGTPRTYWNNTVIAEQVSFASWILDWNRDENGAFITSRRQVVDISGDGICEAFLYFEGQLDENGQPVDVHDEQYGDSWPRALRHLGRNVVINAISVGDTENLAEWYANFLPRGTNAFAMHADSFDSFGDAIKVKILREITSLSDSFD